MANQKPPALAGFDTLPASANVRAETVAALFDVSTNTVWRWAKAGLLPKPSKIGANTTVWNVGQLRASLAAITQNKAA
ncbi:MAG: helix-turn-helix domain-containing protein [Pseudomonadota bacterium]